jgi:RAV-like factor
MRKKLQKDGKELKEEKETLKNKVKQKGFRLFGVQINEVELQLQPCFQTGTE